MLLPIYLHGMPITEWPQVYYVNGSVMYIHVSLLTTTDYVMHLNWGHLKWKCCTVNPSPRCYLEAPIVHPRCHSVHCCLSLSHCLSPADNKHAIVAAGALNPLIILLGTESAEVQCNACGCITTLATTGLYMSV